RCRYLEALSLIAFQFPEECRGRLILPAFRRRAEAQAMRRLDDAHALDPKAGNCVEQAAGVLGRPFRNGAVIPLLLAPSRPAVPPDPGDGTAWQAVPPC